MTTSVRIHRHPLSGHCHRVELMAALNGIDHELIDVDLAIGEHKREPFLSLNSTGQVPVIEDGDTIVSDSNAILVYLARRYAPNWAGQDALEEAAIQKVLSLAAGDIAFGPAAARLITVFGAPLDPERCIAIAHKALANLETMLEGKEWLIGDRPTIADIAVYSYIAHAPEGNVALSDYPNVRALLERIENLPGFVPMQATKVGLAA